MIGFSQILLVGSVALLLFGPQKLPELGRALGRTINEFKKGTRELLSDVRQAPPAAETPATPTAPAQSAPAPVAAPAAEQAGVSPAAAAEPAAAKAAPPSNPRRLPD